MVRVKGGDQGDRCGGGAYGSRDGVVGVKGVVGIRDVEVKGW